jgi:beta-lactamase class D
VIRNRDQRAARSLPQFDRLGLSGDRAQVGPERMAHDVSAFDYGNADITGAPSISSAVGSAAHLRARADRFLDKLRAGVLPVSARPEPAKEAMVVERTDAYAAWQDGLGVRSEDGWFVGWIETGTPRLFALNRRFDACPSRPASRSSGIRVSSIHVT